MLPPYRQMKYDAKVAMMKTMPHWMRATILLIGLQLLADLVVTQLGGSIGNPIFGTASENPELMTGVTSKDGELLLLARLDVLGVLVGFLTTVEGIRRFLIFGGVFFVLIAPFKMGLLELYWKAFRGEEVKASSILDWYRSPARIGKSIIVLLIVGTGTRILALLALAPGYILYYLTYSGTFIDPSQTGLLSVMAIVSMTAMFVGLLLGFFAYATFAPLSYCLAAQPEYSLPEVFRRGFASIRGFTKRFYYFRLSMLPWHILSNLTYGVTELYIFPYVTFSSLQFLQVAAVERQNQDGATEQGEAEIDRI